MAAMFDAQHDKASTRFFFLTHIALLTSHDLQTTYHDIQCLYSLEDRMED